MSQHFRSSPAERARRSSFASEKTLVDTSSRKVNVNEKIDKYDRKSSTDSRASSSSLPSIMEKAVQKVKSKLKEKDTAPKPKPKRPVHDSYPDTVHMWKSLAQTRL